MSDPPWMQTAIMAIGTTEAAGSADNPKIITAVHSIGDKFPEQKSYADSYHHDSTAWCGCFVAWAMSQNNIEPQFGPTDTDRWMWAQSWLQFGQPCMPIRGAVMVFTREGGGHVAFLDSITASGDYKVLGGNQSDAVNIATQKASSFLGARWPDGFPLPAHDPSAMPMIEQGDEGPAVSEAQRLLCGVEVDGDFGPTTDQATRTFQIAKSLEVDGVIGPNTWEALYEGSPLTPTGQAVADLARNSALAKVSWRDRGKAPVGYIIGMALTYWSVFNRRLTDDAVKAMGKTLGSADKDVLKWYQDELDDLEWPLDSAEERLRALFAIQIGLGMRESSGRFCEGRDMSASNTSSDTCEAGLFQTSWNANGASSEMRNLFDDWADAQNTQGMRVEYSEGVKGSKDEWNCYGSGNGLLYQAMSKIYPQFHTEFTAIGMRYLRAHWGPIGRREVELRNEAYDLLIDVETIEGGIEPVPPEPPEGEVDAALVAAQIVDAIEPVIAQVLAKYTITRKE